MDLIQQFSHMDKQVQERHIRCLDHHGKKTLSLTKSNKIKLKLEINL